MKGLEYIRIESSIAWDGDLEHMSAEAFRMFIELIGISAHDLSDGKVPIERAKKLCNSTHFDAALDELTNARMVTFTNTDTIVIRNYRKYQLSRAEVLQMRAKNRDRVMRYRQRYSHVTNGERNACVMPEYREQSKSKSITPPIVPPIGEDFLEFWKLYPRKDGKARAEKAWAKWAGAKVSSSVILGTLKTRLPELKKREREYIPLPATWLNGEPWRDEPDVPPVGSKPERPRIPIEEAQPAWDNPNAAIISGDPIPEEFLREEW